ncbi:MAG: prepilin peptidase [Actinobacteria bacterium]|nr:prepilin peptidase [Actinomycetota bacterium]MDI6830487.1 A24 family peptidase [Actinomycetota bacterium]
MATARLAALLAFAAAASYHDLRYRRVPNALVLAFLVGGSAILACGGWSALGRGLRGMLLGFLVLLPAFFLRMVGGGDVKSLAVIGLLAGPSLLWPAFLLGAVAAGMAGAMLIAARRLRRRKGKGAGEGRAGIPYAAFLSLSAALCALLF